MTGLDFLGKVEVLKGLDQDHLSAIQAICVEEEYKQGDQVFAMGAEADALRTIVEGRIDLHFEKPGHHGTDKRTITSIGSSMSFGWSSVVSPYRYRSSAFVVSKTCRVMKIGKEALNGLMEKDKALGYRVMMNVATVIARRFNQLRDELAKYRGDDIISNW